MEKVKVCKRQLPSGWQPDNSPMPEVLQKVFIARNTSWQDATDFSLKNLHDYRLLKDIDKATTLLERAIKAQKNILISGDYDADGATSCALAVYFLRAMGAAERVSFMIPDRGKFGYGLTPELVLHAQSTNPDIIVTVDNGISSVEGVATAKQAGIQVLVTDHHLPAKEIPDADAIVNPNQPECAFPSKNLAGVGVIFYVLIALRARLRASGWFQSSGIKEPNLHTGLDLVALGTIADVVPMDSNNRILVQNGLKNIKSGKCRPGIKALAMVCEVDLAGMVVQDIGFRLAPCLNAAGRLDDMKKGVITLLSDDYEKALRAAKELRELNKERRAIEAKMLDKTRAMLAAINFKKIDIPPGLCVCDSTWHIGVVGIIASRLRDKYHRPAIVMAPDPVQHGLLKGSARSIENLHIRDVLVNIDAHEPGLMISFGGHAMAAGLTLDASKLARFRELFVLEVARQLTEEMRNPKILVDGELLPNELNIDLARQCRSIVPWGKEFPAPVFTGDFQLGSSRIIGKKKSAKRHLKLRVKLLKAKSSRWLDAWAFNVNLDDWKGNAKNLNLAYELDINRYQGIESMQLLVRHWSIVSA